MSGLEDWWEGGERVLLELDGSVREVFVRRGGGRGSVLTLLHGFPSSSYDWASVAGALAGGHRLLLADFLGFGASQKPLDHVYSIHEQADLVEALWARERITATSVLAHDYAVSVTQELLARRAEGSLSVELEQVHLLNGGIYPELHRPEPTQTALLDPEHGARISARIDEALFVAALGPTFAAGYDASAAGADMWRAMSRGGGQAIAHLLIRYITDRARHRDRWVGALEAADVPLAFTWGMLDPVSGAHMVERIAERLPHARLTTLTDVCHWPALEAPERVAAAVLAG